MKIAIVGINEPWIVRDVPDASLCPILDAAIVRRGGTVNVCAERSVVAPDNTVQDVCRALAETATRLKRGITEDRSVFDSVTAFIQPAAEFGYVKSDDVVANLTAMGQAAA